MSTTSKNGTAGLRLAIDYAPLVIFFLVNFLAPQALTMKLVSSFSHSLSDLDQMSALVVSRAIVATSAFMPAKWVRGCRCASDSIALVALSIPATGRDAEARGATDRNSVPKRPRSGAD